MLLLYQKGLKRNSVSEREKAKACWGIRLLGDDLGVCLGVFVGVVGKKGVTGKGWRERRCNVGGDI